MNVHAADVAVDWEAQDATGFGKSPRLGARVERVDLSKIDARTLQFSSEHEAVDYTQPAAVREEEEEKKKKKKEKTTRAPSDGSHISLRTAYINLVKANVGPGCLALPCVFAGCNGGGIVPCLAIITVCAATGLYAQGLILGTQKMLRTKGYTSQTYDDVCLATMGNFGAQASKTLLCLLQLGICTVFINYVSSNSVAMLPRNSSLHYRELVFMYGCFSLMISQGRSVKAFAIFVKLAMFSMVLALIGIFSVTIDSGKNMNWSTVPEKPLFIAKQHPMRNLVIAYGNMAYSISTGIGLVLPIENAIHKDDKHLVKYVVQGSLFTACIIFAMLGAGTGLVFADPGSYNTFCERSSDVTAQFELMDDPPAPRWMLTVLNGILIAAVILCFPLQLHPAVEIIERVFGIAPPLPPPPAPTARKAGDWSSFATGSMVESSPVFGSSNPNRLLSFNGGRQTSPLGSGLLTGDVVHGRAVGVARGRCDWLYWRLLRATLVGTVTVLAAYVPDLALLISLVGCVAAGMIGMVFPVAMNFSARRMCGEPLPPLKLVFGAIVVCLGTFAITVGDFFTMQAIIATATKHDGTPAHDVNPR